MALKICLVVPEAPMLPLASAGKQRELKRNSLRIGILDNSKGNADHLLRFVVEGIQSAIAIKSIVSLRKVTSGKGAPASVLDQLAADADFVVSAMAD